MSEEAFNIVTLLVDRHVEAGKGARAALLEGGRARTYAQLLRATRALAGRLSALDGRPGQRVAVASEDSLLMMTALLGIMRAGKVAVLLPTLPGGYEPYVQGAAPELLVTTSAMRSRLPGFAEERVLVLDSDEALLSGPEPAPLPPVPATRGADAFCLFTSGTTGSPSAVAHRHQDMEVTNEDYGAEVLGLTENDVTYSPSPLFFAYGLNSAHFGLYHGATAVLPGTDRRPQVVLDTLQRHRATVFFTVPTLYRLILDKTRGGDLSGVRLCVSAGEALPARVFEEWRERFGKPILDGIGTTELLSTFISQRPGEERAGCTGRPVRGFEVRLLDADGREVAPGQQGVLWVRGRTHPDRYLHSEEATRRRFRDGGFITNDVFLQDADGFFHHCGRSDDMVKVGGQWVSPCGVESALLEHPAVSECAVVNRVDAWGLPRPSAYVVLRDGHARSDALARELQGFCRQRLGGGQGYPHFVHFLDALPRTLTGKVRRFLLGRNDAMAHTPEAPSTSSFVLDRARFEALVAQGYNQVPLVRRLESGGLRPVDILRALPERYRFLLESTRVSQDGRYSILGAQPFSTFVAKNGTYRVDNEPREGDPISGLREQLKRWRGIRLPGMPLFCGGAVGFFAYEANHYFEQLPRHRNDDLGLPDIVFLFVRDFVVVDHQESSILVVATGDDFDDCTRRVESLERMVRKAKATSQLEAPANTADSTFAAYTSNFTADEYVAAVLRVQEYIRAGDTYQVNLSQRLKVDWPLPPLRLYETLSTINPVHFASYFELDGFHIVSASPERLVRVENGRAVTRPIAGTRRKGTPEENERFIQELRTSEKERAEHAMLVDLERNDLGRVCTYGTVQVSKLMEITEYAHVMHIESEVEGEVARDKDLLDVVQGMFPGGTITGVPKIRTMEIITELEPNTRGLYTGSIGYLSFAGDMDLNIVIRTILLKGQEAYVQVGGGIVYDSNPRQEYRETLNKARSQLLALATRGAKEGA